MAQNRDFSKVSSRIIDILGRTYPSDIKSLARQLSHVCAWEKNFSWPPGISCHVEYSSMYDFLAKNINLGKQSQYTQNLGKYHRYAQNYLFERYKIILATTLIDCNSEKIS